MSTNRTGPQANKSRLRLLILDGTPGATTLLVLAAHRALPQPQIVLIPDTGWYPTRTYEHLDRLTYLAASAGIETLWVDAGTGTVAATHTPSESCPLPLHTRTPNGALGQLPNGCAQRQTAAIDSAIRGLLDGRYPRSAPQGSVAECLLGLGAEQASWACRAQAAYRRNTFPLVELGWTTADCRAHLAMHDLVFAPDMACIACPVRSNAAWAELRATDPRAWHEAFIADAAVRNRPATPAHGMPAGTTGYLHPTRIPLTEVDLDTAPDATIDAGSEGCVPCACRGINCLPPAPDGGAT